MASEKPGLGFHGRERNGRVHPSASEHLVQALAPEPSWREPRPRQLPGSHRQRALHSDSRRLACLECLGSRGTWHWLLSTNRPLGHRPVGARPGAEAGCTEGQHQQFPPAHSTSQMQRPMWSLCARPRVPMRGCPGLVSRPAAIGPRSLTLPRPASAESERLSQHQPTSRVHEGMAHVQQRCRAGVRRENYPCSVMVSGSPRVSPRGDAPLGGSLFQGA